MFVDCSLTATEKQDVTDETGWALEVSTLVQKGCNWNGLRVDYLIPCRPIRNQRGLLSAVKRGATALPCLAS